MNNREEIDFARIAEAIGYIRANYRKQPHLDEIAAKIGLNSSHFQRMFTMWAGVSPKKFLHYVTIEHAKKILQQGGATLFDTAYAAGVSGTGRLHDMFIAIEGMTHDEYRNGGENLTIKYSFAHSPFGEIITASTLKGVCYMAFAEDQDDALTVLCQKFPNAGYSMAEDEVHKDEVHKDALSLFTANGDDPGRIKLHLKGTDFQIKVWETLLKIPAGMLTTYGNVAKKIGNPRACRAVGTAIGDNPVSLLIPCHRVIRASGELGGYHWGESRKAAIIGWEFVRNQEL